MNYLINNLSTNWKKFLQEQFKQSYMQKIDKFLFDNKNKIIFPSKELIFKCFDFFNIEDTKVVIFGQDPYFNNNQANGLCFSVNENVTLPPSLKNIFKELNNDLAIGRTNPDLSDWALQGVLLINSSLTVFCQQPNSHKDIGWRFFISKIINLLNDNPIPIVFVLLGLDAAKLEQFIDSKHIIIKTSHPSPLSAYRGFFNSKIFSKINYHLINKIKW